jgi:hypothetical protein
MRRKIAVATDRRGDSIQHFGQCLAFKIYESSGSTIRFLGTRENLWFCGSADRGYEEDTARLISDCDLLIVAAIRASERQAVSGYRTRLLEIEGPIETAIEQIFRLGRERAG